MNIYVTGDKHGEIERLMTEIEKMKDNSIFLVVGDFGGVWAVDPAQNLNLTRRLEKILPSNINLIENFKEEDERLNGLNELLVKKKSKLLFICGNHENFDRLNALQSYYYEDFNATLKEVKDNILYIPRNTVLHIEGTSFYCFGGAPSQDISGGIVDPYSRFAYEKMQAAIKSTKPFRIKHFSWWEEEVPTLEKTYEAVETVDELGKIDIVLTHEGPPSTTMSLGFSPADNELTPLLSYIDKTLQYGHWFFGHYHRDRRFSDTNTCVYNEWWVLKENEELDSERS